jgi:hypothetical protein
MSEGVGDPVALAIARLEVAVERLALGLARHPGGGRGAAAIGGGDAPTLRAEVAALAARLDASIARLREVVREESEPGGSAVAERRDRGEEE